MVSGQGLIISHWIEFHILVFLTIFGFGLWSILLDANKNCLSNVTKLLFQEIFRPQNFFHKILYIASSIIGWNAFFLQQTSWVFCSLCLELSKCLFTLAWVSLASPPSRVKQWQTESQYWIGKDTQYTRVSNILAKYTLYTVEHFSCKQNLF